jgi:predicted O-methyltransferase YrrM
MLAHEKPKTTAVRGVRPKAIFSMVEQRFPNQNIDFRTIIPPTDIGGATLLEGALLAALIRLRDAQHIFEFGTYKGATALLLAANSAATADIVTLDIENDKLTPLRHRATTSADSRDNDHYLRTVRVAEGAPYIQRAPHDIQRKITQILCDSHALDIDAHLYRGRFDLVFIDGGHDRATIVNDTEKALAMSSANAVIAWHDYGSMVHGDVTEYVDELSHTLPIVNIDASMLAVHWVGLGHLFA